jgi:hypothetical protein
MSESSRNVAIIGSPKVKARDQFVQFPPGGDGTHREPVRYTFALSRSRRDAVRCAIHAVSRIIDECQLASALASIRGRIAHVKKFNDGSARRLARYLDCALVRRT